MIECNGLERIIDEPLLPGKVTPARPCCDIPGHKDEICCRKCNCTPAVVRNPGFSKQRAENCPFAPMFAFPVSHRSQINMQEFHLSLGRA